MKIISFVTQKGGAGKTTLATNLAVACSHKKKTTLLIDADARQSTALEWFEGREEKGNPICMAAPDQETLFKILSLAEKNSIDRVLIDTQGADSPLVNDAISKSDFCIMPCGSGGFDIPAQRTTAAVIKRLGRAGAFVVTKCPPRGKEASETKSILRNLGFPSPEYQISNLKAYKDAAICSLSVLEYEPKGKAAKEVESLYKWLEKQLKSNPLLDTMKKEVANA